MLGGRVLARTLRKRLGPAVGEALTFFEAYGERLDALWERLVHVLDGAAQDGAARTAILDAAQDTFDVVQRWLVAAGEE